MRRKVFAFLYATGLLFSCSDDVDVATESIRSLAEVAAENDAEIHEFLQTHFYNYEAFNNPSEEFDFRIQIDTLAGENRDKIPLAHSVTPIHVRVSASEFLLADRDEEVTHTLYYLVARQGTGESPTVADSVFLRYEAKLLDGTTFDASRNNPTGFDLAELQGPAPVQESAGFFSETFHESLRGLAEGIPQFKVGEEPTNNGDGTVEAKDYGVGLLIFPSGLGNFYGTVAGVPPYSPLLYTIDLFKINPTDHDKDGVPSIEEDVNANNYLHDDDTNNDGTPDYLDPDSRGTL